MMRALSRHRKIMRSNILASKIPNLSGMTLAELRQRSRWSRWSRRDHTLRRGTAWVVARLKYISVNASKKDAFKDVK